MKQGLRREKKAAEGKQKSEVAEMLVKLILNSGSSFVAQPEFVVQPRFAIKQMSSSQKWRVLQPTHALRHVVL